MCQGSNTSIPPKRGLKSRSVGEAVKDWVGKKRETRRSGNANLQCGDEGEGDSLHSNDTKRDGEYKSRDKNKKASR